MLKVKLKENLRYFDYDDTDFQIQGDEIKELPERELRSYTIKWFLFSGRLQVVDGELLFNYKNSIVFINKEGLYGTEFNKFFTKDLEFDTLTFIDKEKVPKHILEKLIGEVQTEEVKKPITEEVKKPITEEVKKPITEEVKKNEKFYENVKKRK